MPEPVSHLYVNELTKMPELSKYLPYSFATSGNTIVQLSVRCGNCSNKIDADNIYGSFGPVVDGATFRLMGHAVCYKCCSLTPIEGKLFDDGTSMYNGAKGWEKGSWGTSKVGLWNLSSQFLIKRWQTILPAVIASLIVFCWILFRNK